MNLDEAINSRYSVRSFLDRPVEKQLIEEIISLAVRSPSWGNTQPWEIIVTGGDITKELADAFCNKLQNGVLEEPDFKMPEKFEGHYSDRYKTLGREVFRLKGIGREDQEARLNHVMNNFRSFGAPSFIYLVVDKSLDTPYPLFDAGLLAAHICLLAVSRGLGTCLLAALARYPETTREILKLAPEKQIVLGIGLGYPDEGDPVNQIKSARDPLENNVAFKGF